jgi:hypothetical protein
MVDKKLTPEVCYAAGLFSKAARRQKNLVHISTSIPELQQKFVEIAVKKLGVLPNKIIMDDSGVGFYHSRVAKRLQDIIDRETYVFKEVNVLSRNYLAGMFDISGHYRGAVEIRHVTPKDAFMLENLGVHTRGDSIMNVSLFVSLIKGYSILLDRIRL